MKSIKKSIKDILEQAAIHENLEEEYIKPSYSKWRGLINNWVKDSKTYNKFRSFLFFTQIFIGGASVGIAVLVKDIQTTYIAVSIWVAYAVINIFVNLVYRFYPDDYEKFIKDVKIIKLITLSERLAGKLALFERLSDHDVIDNTEIISQISYRIKDYSELDEEIQTVIQNCVNPKSRFSSSRETNVKLSLDDYDLTDNEKVKLNHITREISETAEVLFGGKGYSAKLYLRIKKTTIKEQEVEILVPFSKFPTKEGYGSSWIKSRGNLSSVWECLERGKETIVDFSDQDLYYKSMLTICLPGRIGILAIHNEENEVFEQNVSELDCKALSLITKQLVMEALAVNE
ncbi:hypothetical protein ACFPYN_05565 [Paenisporosarcina macmurdoensis]|uniref:GAF domain-containing protein n=1 Tax=Paenisporosarcina macmurdoensis TaxID=212659 RepID=A0ABW1L4L7_9BACL